jgi:hypothetical protein
MFGITGAGLSVVKYYSNDHKKARWNRDAWDRVSRIYAPFTQSADPTNISIAKYVLASELSIIDVNAKVLIWDVSDGERSSDNWIYKRSIFQSRSSRRFRREQSMAGMYILP